MAKEFAVIGSPIEHSKSPVIHEAAYAMLGLDWAYGKRDITAEMLPQFLEETTLSGLSVTMPLKERAFELAIRVDERAAKSKTANTLFRHSDGWVGYNTDVFGLEKALAREVAQSVLILGSGATAKNAVLAISEIATQGRIHIKARNTESAIALASWALELGITVTTSAEVANLSDYDLVVSTLPPLSDTDGWFTGTPTGTLLDVAYNPWPSALAKQWLGSGGNVISGIEMLIWQAIAQIRVFKNGSVAEPLENEEEIAKAMRSAAMAEG
jgi:shikimate dehydrogenase